jgi:hypothetical protein
VRQAYSDKESLRLMAPVDKRRPELVEGLRAQERERN